MSGWFCECETNQNTPADLFCSNAASACQVMLSLCWCKEATFIAGISAWLNSRIRLFVATHHSRVHLFFFPFDCHILCWPVHSRMPIDPHPEEKWLQWFEIRSQKPYNYNAASSTMICASKYTTYHWIDKPMFSQLSWTDDQSIDTLAKLTKCEVTVLSAMP
jgi:hypothetical protein